MIRELLSKIGRFLREHQDPRYRNAPWILPQRAWRGSGEGPLTKEQLAQFNVKDLGFDPEVVAGQPINRMLFALVSRAAKSCGSGLRPKRAPRKWRSPHAAT